MGVSRLESARLSGGVIRISHCSDAVYPLGDDLLAGGEVEADELSAIWTE